MGKSLTRLSAAVLATGASLAVAQPPGLQAGDSLACNFTTVSSVVYENGKIVGKTTDKENNLIRFVGLTTKTPRLIGERGSNPLVVLENSTEKFVLVEQGDDVGGLISYTIFKEAGVAIWTKAYSILAYPFGLVAMGACR